MEFNLGEKFLKLNFGFGGIETFSADWKRLTKKINLGHRGNQCEKILKLNFSIGVIERYSAFWKWIRTRFWRFSAEMEKYDK